MKPNSIKLVGDPLLPAGVELDQRMHDALVIASPAGQLTESQILVALCHLNTRGCDLIPGEIFARARAGSHYKGNIPKGRSKPLSELKVGTGFLRPLIREAVAADPQGKTLGATGFIRALLNDAFTRGESFIERSNAIDLLAVTYGFEQQTKVSQIPALQTLLRRMNAAVVQDDYQYMMSFSGGRLSFRIVSTLGDYVQQGDSGLWVPERALLTHLGGIGLFSADQIHELEELINSSKATEADLQAFFERYPHFLRRWDYREVHPHVYLTREVEGPLIPDFILTNKETQETAILDLKRAKPKSSLVRRQRNRDRFADAVMEARAQLLEYRDWFDQPANRLKLKTKLGMEIYRPRLMAVIGRKAEFSNELERQKLRDRNSDIEIVTYDDIAAYARERQFRIVRAGD
jgi:hypothetical protein